MKIIFSHQNFPAQFGHFGAYLARCGWDVTFFTAARDATPPEGCRMLRMGAHRDPSAQTHRYLRGLESAVLNAQGFANAAMRARDRIPAPDIVVAHSGWGSGSFAKAVWPETKFVSYAEWYYRWPPRDTGRPAAAEGAEDSRAHAMARNLPMLLDFDQADRIWCPTQFQADQFPATHRARMTVRHDGVDCETFAPGPARIEGVPEGAEVVTYATRGMEPHRGFPEFMRALAVLQKTRPRLHAVIAGQDRVAYGEKLPDGESWKARMLAELDLDLSRVHFAGLLPHGRYRALLQASQAHVYLTVPFVLSWSMIEAMAAGCPLVVSDSPPVREVIPDDSMAEIVPSGDAEAVAVAVARLLDDPQTARRKGEAARRRALAGYDRRWIWPARAQELAELCRGGSG
ncbi:glycosyltransferase [Mangrovicoccus algicola]|uniref:Glycosyltransferase n=1 Tax=Mangrovicoccus algicola TaxID=2771008 RepID=A0A8J7CVF3_9RHOB|nr:glycosyltransferase [Mangrovicoccus algicola]MBE3638669.1 glycosyltransferase [Mangrovicoccus algicola]